METLDRMHDCCGDDYSHGTFSRIIRKLVREVAALENTLSIGLTLVLAVILYAFMQFLRTRQSL